MHLDGRGSKTDAGTWDRQIPSCSLETSFTLRGVESPPLHVESGPGTGHFHFCSRTSVMKEQIEFFFP